LAYKLDYLFFCYLIFGALYIFWIVILYPTCGFSFDSINSFLWLQKLFNLMQSHFSILVLIFWAIGIYSEKCYLCLNFQVFILFVRTGVWTQGLILARQALYHLGNALSPVKRFIIYFL
jgi:hypothetical protein